MLGGVEVGHVGFLPFPLSKRYRSGVAAAIDTSQFVVPGLVPRTHVFKTAAQKTWMAGTSPAMTKKLQEAPHPS
jgi:hypothetical protein